MERLYYLLILFPQINAEVMETDLGANWEVLNRSPL